ESFVAVASGGSAGNSAHAQIADQYLFARRTTASGYVGPQTGGPGRNTRRVQADQNERPWNSDLRAVSEVGGDDGQACHRAEHRRRAWSALCGTVHVATYGSRLADVGRLGISATRSGLPRGSAQSFAFLSYKSRTLGHARRWRLPRRSVRPVRPTR